MAARRDDRGFTVLELIVVVVIMGVLLLIAVPAFQGVRNRAADTAARARATDGLKTQKVYFTDSERYGDAAQVEALEPTVDFETYDPATGPAVQGKVYVRLDGAAVVTLVSRSSTGRCFWTRDTDGVTAYATADCDADPATLTFGNRW